VGDRVTLGTPRALLTDVLTRALNLGNRATTKEGGAGIDELPADRLGGVLPYGNLPTFPNYFVGADPAGSPDAPTGAAGFATSNAILLTWDLPAESLWRTWEVYEKASSDPNWTVAPGDLWKTVDQQVVSVPHVPGAGPYVYAIRAKNTRGEYSGYARLGPFTCPLVSTSDISNFGTVVANIVAAQTIYVEHLSAAHAKISSAMIDTIQAGQVIAGTFTGFLIKTAASGSRVEMSSEWLKFYTGSQYESDAGFLMGGTDGVNPYIELRSPVGPTYSYLQLTSEDMRLGVLEQLTPEFSGLNVNVGGEWNLESRNNAVFGYEAGALYAAVNLALNKLTIDSSSSGNGLFIRDRVNTTKWLRVWGESGFLYYSYDGGTSRKFSYT
jgi:hypothetical protein